MNSQSDAFKRLQKLFDGDVFAQFSSNDFLIEYHKDLKKYSTMKLKASGHLITIKNKEALKLIIKKLTEEKLDYNVIGWGANLLLKKFSDTPYLQLDFEFPKSIFDEQSYQGSNKLPKELPKEFVLPASLSLAVMTSFASKVGLLGWEVFTGIPASLGGAIYMNAGTTLGEIGKLIKEVKVITKFGEEKNIIINYERDFSYRKNHFLASGDVVYEATVMNLGVSQSLTKTIRDYLEMRNKSQPLREATCGCVFKNYKTPEGRGVTCNAGKFIDIIGLKGFTFSDLKVSPKHANFLENSGESTFEDVMFVVDVLKKEMLLQYGISFETEAEFFKT